MSTLLITGGAGFIGSNFVRRRRKTTPSQKLVVLDALTYAGNVANLDGVDGIELVRGDICDAGLVRRTLGEHGVEAVVHFAAESHVDRSILGATAFARTNVEGTATLLAECRASGKIRRFVHISTDEVYGDLGPADAAFRETTPLSPRSPYAASKAASDMFVRAWFETFRFPAIITRCSNNYGPRQFPEKLIPLMILRALENKPLPIYGDGSNVRDWIYVDDHCAAVERVLEAGREGEVYNIGAGCEQKNIDIVREILRLLGKPESLIEFVADRLGHDRRYAIDASKTRALGWEPSIDFRFGLTNTIKWYTENPNWVKAAKNRLEVFK